LLDTARAKIETRKFTYGLKVLEYNSEIYRLFWGWMACSPMSRAVPSLQTSSRGRQQILLGSDLTSLQWRLSQRGAVR